jgi:DNA-directed RNA polymerase delta subunit
MHFVVKRWNGDHYDCSQRSIVGVFPTFQEARDFATQELRDVVNHFYHHTQVDENCLYKAENAGEVWGYCEFMDLDEVRDDNRPYCTDFANWDELPERVQSFMTMTGWKGKEQLVRHVDYKVQLSRDGDKIILGDVTWDDAKVPK